MQRQCGRTGREAALAGTLAIPLIKRLRVPLGDGAADALHKGATSQDVADTILMLQAKKAKSLLLTDLDRIAVALAAIARQRAGTAAVWRTLLQDARRLRSERRASVRGNRGCDSPVAH